MVALVCDRSFLRIAGSVVVLVHARLFCPIVGLGLSCGAALWVMSFPILVSVCAPNLLFGNQSDSSVTRQITLGKDRAYQMSLVACWKAFYLRSLLAGFLARQELGRPLV